MPKHTSVGSQLVQHPGYESADGVNVCIRTATDSANFCILVTLLNQRRLCALTSRLPEVWKTRKFSCLYLTPLIWTSTPFGFLSTVLFQLFKVRVFIVINIWDRWMFLCVSVSMTNAFQLFKHLPATCFYLLDPRKSRFHDVHTDIIAIKPFHCLQ